MTRRPDLGPVALLGGLAWAAFIALLIGQMK